MGILKLNKLLSLAMDPRTFVTLIVFLVMYLIKQWNSKWTDHLESGISSSTRLEFHIAKTWNSEHLDHDPVRINLLSLNDAGIKVLVEAPFFNDPPNPGGAAGEPYAGLWDFEVVELFFSNDKEQYVELELSPHGQHLVLLLNGYRKPFKDKIPLEFKSTIEGSMWKGEAIIPAIYFPPDISKMNAYAIHGSGDKRIYESLFPTPKGKYTDPDFHRLGYFHAIDFTRLLPSNTGSRYSSGLWQLSPS